MTIQFKTREEYDQEDWARYLQKKRDISEKKRAKFEAEGFKCKVDGCGQSFRDFAEYHEHINSHKEDNFKAMICDQANCGKKFKHRKKYFEHIEEHKVVSKRKIINGIRAVLMYNKHGLLIDCFEREYRVQNGKPVPYKFMGYECLYDLLVNIPDVVKMLPISGGQHLLLAVPDEKTQHIAKAVGNQRDNVEGFNRKTAEVISRVGKDVKLKIEKAKGIKDKQVSDFVKKQFVELLESDDHLDGILLKDLPTVYYKEFGYKIDYDEFGFQNLEEFCLHGLADSVDMDLDKFQWKIVEKGMLGNTMSLNSLPSLVLPDKVKKNIRVILDANSNGLSEEEFKSKYASRNRPLNFRDYSCKTFLEFICSIPDCVKVASSSDGQFLLYPPVPKQEIITETGQVLEELSNNILHLLDGHTDGVPVESFLRGYEGYFGDIEEKMISLGVDNITSLLSLCDQVCNVRTSSYGDCIVPVTSSSASSRKHALPLSNINSLLASLQRILSNNKDGRVSICDIPQYYRDICGKNIDHVEFGFQSLKLLIHHVVSSSSKIAVNDDVLYLIEPKKDKNAEDAFDRMNMIQAVEPGWVRIVASRKPETLCMQLESRRKQLKDLEADMENFYTGEMRGEMVDVESLRSGNLVASLYTDLAWHRAKVVTILEDVVELEFVDWGWRARVMINTIKKLDPMFLTLPFQNVNMRYTDLEVVNGVNWGDVVREGRGRGRITRSSSGDMNIELFMRTRSKSQVTDQLRDAFKNSLHNV